MVKPKEADSPPGLAELHKTCNANRFELYDSVGPYVLGVESNPTLDFLEPGPLGSGPSVRRGGPRQQSVA